MSDVLEGQESGVVGRRTALASMAGLAGLFVASRLSDEASAKSNKKRGKRGRRGRRGRTGSNGATGPAGPAGSQTVSGTATAAIKTAALRNESVATCPSGTVLLGCGFDAYTDNVGSNPIRALNHARTDLVPDSTAGTCTAALTYTDNVPGDVSATAYIIGYAICSTNS
ncbi:MAG: hypothetical protein QM692_22530 [Thermomicrobiales bacterium]